MGTKPCRSSEMGAAMRIHPQSLQASAGTRSTAPCTPARATGGAFVYETLSRGYLSYSGDLDTLRQRMNISSGGYGGNKAECFLLEFCSVTAANGIL